MDGSNAAAMDPMIFPMPAGAVWNVDQWNVGQWGMLERMEGESVTGGATDAQRPRGVSASVQLTHADAVPMAIRDFELRYLPVPRPVRSLVDDPSS